MSIELIIASDPEVDDLFAQIFCDNIEVFEVLKKDNGRYNVIFNLKLGGAITKNVSSDLDQLIDVLNLARKKLG